MKTRRHHNTDGRRKTQRGKRKTEVRHIARRLGVPYVEPQAVDAVDPVEREARSSQAPTSTRD